MTEPNGSDELAAAVGAWVRGWALCRDARVQGLPDRRGLPGRGWQVDGLSPSRSSEVVLARPHPDLVDEVQARLQPDTWLTVVTAQPWPLPAPPGLRRLETHEVLMSWRVDDGAAPPERHEVLLVDQGPRASVAVHVDGVPAAEGTAAVADDVVVVDRVRTAATHRRQGLGTVVMRALGGWAAQQGARTGLLVASPDGQALYARLGWHPLAPVATFAADESGGSSGLPAPAPG